MQHFPKYQYTLFHRILLFLLQSIMGQMVLVLAAVSLTSLFFLFQNKYLSQNCSWQEKSWKGRAENGLTTRAKCIALKHAYRRWDNCTDVEKRLKEHTVLEIGSIEQKSTDPEIRQLWAELDEKNERQNKFEQANSQRIFITLSGQHKPKETTHTPEEPYLRLYGMLEITSHETPAERSLQARLWVAALDHKKYRFSKPIRVSLFTQTNLSLELGLKKLGIERLPVGLSPTQTLLEPKSVGRWLVHNFKKIVKEIFDAGYLLPEAKKLKKTEAFLNAWMKKTFSHPTLSFSEESFWLTFFNGTNNWGLIQWLSVFFAIFVLLQLFIRFVLASIEATFLADYKNTHPLDFKKFDHPGTLHQVRTDFTQMRSAFPRFQNLFLLRVMDQEALQIEELVNEKLEKSRKSIDFLVASLSSIGFIGTIVGIAFAINQAHQVVTPDEFMRLQAIKSLSTDLALAFSTTFVALVLTLICDFFAKQQWKKEDDLLEEIKVVHQAWLWQSKNTPSEQAECSILPKD